LATRSPADEHFRVLFVGRLSEQKDPLILIDAFQQLPCDIREKATLTLVGEGPLRPTIEQQIAKYQLQQQVTLSGQIDDISSLMQQATILVLPSRWEGMPNVVLEAMANGLPVVATCVDGTCDLINDGHTGWLVPPQSRHMLSNAMTDALSNPAKRRQFASNSLKLISDQFTWMAVIDRYDSLLRSLSCSVLR
jgi:glycosyltransferase involved in cell wall biosynthesis